MTKAHNTATTMRQPPSTAVAEEEVPIQALHVTTAGTSHSMAMKMTAMSMTGMHWAIAKGEVPKFCRSTAMMMKALPRFTLRSCTRARC